MGRRRIPEQRRGAIRSSTRRLKPLGLTANEVDDLVNFLSALTSDRFSELRAAELDRQRTAYQYRLAVQRVLPK